MGDPIAFSVLNERLRPRFTAMERLCDSLDTLEDGPQRPGTVSGGSTTQSTILRDVSQTQEDSSSTTTKPEQEDVVTEGLTSLTEEGDIGPEPLTMSMINDCSKLFLTIEDAGPDGSGELTVVRDSLTIANDGPDGLTVVIEGDGDGSDAVSEDRSTSRRSYIDGMLPDLIRSGRPLNRRRTLGPVSDTLKEVRREVELSRRRSLKLKAQVDKLQENREGPGWSQHRAKDSKSGGRRENDVDDSAVLQQALQDRDDAMEKKKAMEAELLRSKTEMMLLNNQLLEAVQKRLELALEVEDWKDDVQMILQQQLQRQQQQAAEQAQRKPSRLGLLRRTNRPPLQRPASTPLTYTTGQVPVSTPSPTPQCTPVTWRDRLKRGKVGRHSGQDAEQALQASRPSSGSRLEEGFHTIDL
ncbi:bicaudal D-related protein homolog isoform X3 [Salmo trutta]|uniref:bicaudal D-related protein homolog isoform X3 n=1 Tax=Salmo trutta TaxID=8032 RepID=UPI0011313EE4|nr:bicaudal D-related protein homolog isoform X3 [Salmo trutta]